ncbi:hypothetical protein [Geoglobus sp.]
MKISRELVEDSDYVISLDGELDGIRIDEVWELKHPGTGDECVALLGEIENEVLRLIRRLFAG